MSPDTRLSLVAALKGPSDPATWGRFAQRYGPAIRRWCLERCRELGAADAEDAAEEVAAVLVASIHARMQSYDLSQHRTGGYRAWLRRAALNALSDYLSQRARHHGAGRTTVHDLLGRVEAPESLGQAVEDEFRREALENVILPQVREEFGDDWPAIEALGLADGRGGGGRTAADVAREFGGSPGRLLQIKSRAMRRIRELAQQWEEQEAN